MPLCIGSSDYSPTWAGKREHMARASQQKEEVREQASQRVQTKEKEERQALENLTKKGKGHASSQSQPKGKDPKYEWIGLD